MASSTPLLASWTRWFLLTILMPGVPLLGQIATVDTLTPGPGLERSLKSPDSDFYTLSRETPSYVWLVVDQEGVDVEVRRLDRQGRVLEWHDVAQRSTGTEHVYLLIEEPGPHRIEIRAKGGDKAGIYRITLKEERALTPVDRIRVPQERIYDQAQELLQARREPAEALKLFASTLSTWRQLDDAAYEASTLDNIGFCHRQLEQVSLALGYYKQALPRWRQAGLPGYEANTWINLGFAQRFLDDLEGAQQSYQRAIEILATTKDLRKTAVAFNNLASVSQELGRLEEARSLFEQARALRQKVGDRVGLARTLNNLGWVLTQLGEMEAALSALGQALELGRELGDRQIQTAALNNLGVAHDWAGEPFQALRLLRSALELSRQREVRGGQASALRNLGDVYSHLGDLDQALRCYEQAEELHRQLERPADRAEALIQIGRIHLDTGHLREALSPLSQAVQTLEGLDQPFFLATAFEKLGRTEALLGRPELGKAHLDRARQISRGVGDLRGESKVWLGQGTLKEHQGAFEAAALFYAQARELSRQGGDLHTTIDALAGMARAHREQGDLAAAARHISRALDLTESVRSRAGGELARASFLATRKGLYDFAIDLAVARGREREAFGMYQRGRSRSLLDLVAGSAALSEDPSISRVDPHLVQREKALRRELSATDRRLSERGAQGVKGQEERSRLEQEQAERVRVHAEVIGLIRQQSERQGHRLDPKPLPLGSLQRDVLDESTVLLVYALGDQRSFLWAITQNSFATHELPAKATIAEAAQSYAQLLVLPAELAKAPSLAGRRELHARLQSAPKELKAAAIKLSRIILSPIVDHLKPGKRLAIMAEGPLQAFPFAALPSPRGSRWTAPLVADHEVIYLPSASVLGFGRREFSTRATPPKLLAVFADPVFEAGDPRLRALSPQGTSPPGDPELPSAEGIVPPRAWHEVALRGVPVRLPHSAREAQSITAGLPAAMIRVATSFEASRQAILDDGLKEYRLVHLATHGFLHDTYPQLSGLVFSLFDAQGRAVEGHLHLQDIYDLELAADLVVLSACETGLGKDVPGEGFLGLTHGFLQAGAARVLASLWPVDDAATAALMERFYRGLLDERLSAAAALRQAQHSMWRAAQPTWRHPYYWSGFVLHGEWR